MAIVDGKRSKIYVGDKGFTIKFNCVNPITDAISVGLLVKKPDGSETTWPGEILQDRFILFVSASQNEGYQDIVFNNPLKLGSITGLSPNKTYTLNINSTAININTTGLSDKITFQSFLEVFNTALSGIGVRAFLVGSGIRIISNTLGQGVVITEDSAIDGMFKGYKGLGDIIPGTIGDFEQAGQYIVHGLVQTATQQKTCDATILTVNKLFE